LFVCLYFVFCCCCCCDLCPKFSVFFVIHSILLYIPESKKPKLDDQGKTKSSIKATRRDIQLVSVKNLRQKIDKAEHHGLKELMEDHKFVGCVNHTHILLQHNTKLYIANIKTLSRELFYQIIMFRFGDFGFLKLSESAPIYELAMMALESAESGWTESDGSKEDLATYIANFLQKKAEMLLDYFSIEINDEGNLCSLPLLVDNYIPNFLGLPMFVLRLATEVGAFICSFISFFIHSYIHTFIWSFIIHFIINVFICSFINGFIHLFIHLFFYLFTHSFLHSFIHSFIFFCQSIYYPFILSFYSFIFIYRHSFLGWVGHRARMFWNTRKRNKSTLCLQTKPKQHSNYSFKWKNRRRRNKCNMAVGCRTCCAASVKGRAGPPSKICWRWNIVTNSWFNRTL